MQSPKVKQLLQNKRFVAIVGMLGSSGDGERANAAALAGRMLQEAGITWGELVGALDAPAASRGRDYSQGAATAQVLALQGELQAARRRLADSQRREEIATTSARSAEARVKSLESQLDAARRRIQQLDGTLQRMQAQKQGWTPFETEVQEWVRPGSEDHLGWINKLLGYHQKKLTSWEIDFVSSFMDKPVVSEKQYNVLKRIAEKIGVPLDF